MCQVLAGDLATHETLPRLQQLVHRGNERGFGRVVLIAGNHEAEGVSVGEACEALDAVEGATALQQGVVELDDDFRLIACTLWSDIDEGERESIAKLWKHFWAIKNFSPDEEARLHHADRAWIEAECARAARDGKKAVVATHYPPTRDAAVLGEAHAASRFASAYGTSMEPMLEEHKDTIALWLHGHTHHSHDGLIGGVRLVSNQRGRMIEKDTGFVPDRWIEL